MKVVKLRSINMKLSIDTSNIQKAIIKFDNDIFEINSRKGNSQTLLPFIEEELQNRGDSFSSITSIEVHTGPGSFTGLRVGLSIAQTLAWVLHVPLNGKRIDCGDQIELSYT
jgi:tRNA threonylcarbamoyladenosine biosynthesis protein TsaB